MEAELLTANLAGAQLDRADLTGAKPIGANLIEANLNWANLSRADLTGADLTGADLIEANLSAANLIEANLSKAQLPRANLSGADLNLAKLIEARPVRANLTGANLNWADLSRADLSGANLSGATFEPYVLPPTGAFLGVTGLDTLQWKNSPQALVLLRNGFKDAGRREQERQTTYSLMKWTRINTGGIEGALQYGFFELTTDWGMTPARPLWILLALVPGLALLYMIPVLRPSPGGAALWRVWDKDRARKDQGQDDPERLLARSYRAPLYGLFFSVLSAFQIGWKELSIGSWIARLNPYEYTLKATGWVRTVSGVQSLISVYLLALAVLTYFGRPFE
jgi:uncharacterized protein YjbI with pentapeptide repeats